VLAHDERAGQRALASVDVIVLTPLAPRLVLRYSSIGVRLP
jgi:hypothetical protein